MADPSPVLAGEAQEAGQLGQGVGQAGDRRGVAVAPAAGERLGTLACLVDRRLAGLGGDVVEDLPERGLDLGLGVGGVRPVPRRPPAGPALRVVEKLLNGPAAMTSRHDPDVVPTVPVNDQPQALMQHPGTRPLRKGLASMPQRHLDC